jgi:hypothetical protein
LAAAPAFAATPRAASALITGTETNLQVPAAAVVVFTAGASGSKIEEVVAQASATTLVATTVAGALYLFLYDGTTYHLFDTILVTAITASATAVPFRASNRYANLVLPNGWSLRVSNSIAGNASILKVTALGADF